ncbi:MAG TPA: selenocysteine-specific translation elongation factor [Actinomycetota bacterium]|nr:selenocysteine-specific translation elongation factor [Actinomycetota bacterium]
MAEATPRTLDGGGDPSGSASDLVIATAGHVDHGKSSLIRRLTGIEPDRLAEEKRRGLTIELGYAWCTLPSGNEVGFVDVPGHERFVRTMLSGVGPVGLVLFVVAADEGWKPQSEEHLAIVDLLEVDGAVVALTKRDLVDAERIAELSAQIRGRTRGTRLERAPVVVCSSATGEGIDELIAAIDEMVTKAPEPDRDGRPRLFVDRVFPVAGAGTVVTGTVTGGPIAVGDPVQVHPSGAVARVRGLQTHGHAIEQATPVRRLAVNLARIERDRVERGNVLSTPDAWRPTGQVEVRIRPVRGLAHPVTDRGAFTFHAGSAERPARVRLYGVRSLGGDGAFARIRLADPLVLDVGDRFVLRESGRRETVAGGVVLDPDPPKRPGSGVQERLGARARAGRGDLAWLLVAERGAVRDRDVTALTGVAAGSMPHARRAGNWWVGEDLYGRIAATLRDRLEAFHSAEPLAAGEDLARVRTALRLALARERVDVEPELTEELVGSFEQDGMLVREGASVRLASRLPTAAGERGDRLVDAVRNGEPTPPTVAELAAAGFSRALIDTMVRTGALVRISPDLVLTTTFMEHAVEIVRAAGNDGITVSALRAELGTSRKYAVPLMEHLDRTGVTRRDGDLRFARASAPGPVA